MSRPRTFSRASVRLWPSIGAESVWQTIFRISNWETFPRSNKNFG